LFNDTLKATESPKFYKNWTGPYLVVWKSDDGLLYRLRHCATGKESRAAVHANRLKVYRDDRDTFYLRHNIKPKQVEDPLPKAAEEDIVTPEDEWYPIERVLSHKKVGNKEFYRVRWLDDQASETWEPKENVTQFAIDQYFVEKRRKSTQRRRRQR